LKSAANGLQGNYIMSHQLERLMKGDYSMAYAGEACWHGLGRKVPADLTPAQMLKAASLDWRVEKVPVYGEFNGKQIETGHSALVRDRDSVVLDVVTNDWEPLQNEQAFEFFNRFVMAGNMQMDTAGSIRNGKQVWALAKLTNKFEIFGNDRVEAYMMFSNPHTYASSINIRSVMTRICCSNTMAAAMGEKSSKVYKQSHKIAFNAEDAEVALGIVDARMNSYKEKALLLGSKQAAKEDIVEYFKRVFPVYQVDKNVEAKKELSKNAQIAMAMIETQPGAEFAKGSWWQIVNSVSFLEDHLRGKNEERRFEQAIFGQGATLKNKALELALEYAS
jgi:phage/plasmid-like protein (TIGR03299 family)